MPKNPHADFTPALEGYSGQGKFRFWCQMALPLTYDDSLSYYELLCKVVNYLNHTIEDVANAETNVSRLAEAYTQLQTYVNDYFDDLDVEAELRNVLDAMAEDGTLDDLLDPLVQDHLPAVVDEQIDDVVADQIDDAVAGQIDDVVAEQLPPLVEEGIPGEVSDWLTENVDPVGSAVVVDSSLTISGAAADAKVTGDELTDLKTQLNDVLPGVNNRFDPLLVKKSKNIMPQITADDVVSGEYLKDGSTVENADCAYCSKYIPVEPFRNYVIGFVPAYGMATTPWYAISNGFELYDKNKNFIKNVKPGNDFKFSTPSNAYYLRFNIYSLGGIAYGVCNQRLMLVDGDILPSTYNTYDGADIYVNKEYVENTAEEKADEAAKVVDDKIHYISPNLFDESLQTNETIDPHYYVNGVPYTGTPDYSSAYNCTALFDVEGSTQYTIGIIPEFGGYSAPWANASYGIFFYDAQGNYISGTINTTFTTPSSAKKARFNYAKGIGITLNMIKARCVLVKSDTLPESYIPYYDYYIKERISEIENTLNNKSTRYHVTLSDNALTVEKGGVRYKYQRFGVNNLFDLKEWEINGHTFTSGTDTIGPFANMTADENGDGDRNPQTGFTGGCHGFNNDATGSPTAEFVSLTVYCDGVAVTDGEYYCDNIEFVAVSLVQGSNTCKSAGGGRNILQQTTSYKMDGTKIRVNNIIKALEALHIGSYYGMQMSSMTYYDFISDAKIIRDVQTGSSAYRPNVITGHNEYGKFTMKMYKEGLGTYSHNPTDSKVTASYGKAYFWPINQSTAMEENEELYFAGTYELERVQTM